MNRQEESNILSRYFAETGRFTIFTGRFLRESLRPPFEWHEFARQCFVIGYKTFAIVGITGFILGLVFTLQTQPMLVDFGAESWLPGLIALSIIKEMGPVITALVCAGKIGSGIGAELGSMKVTEQIDAMEVSATNPMRFLVSTRVLATTLMIPLLVVYADAIALFGSFVAMNINSYISSTLFFDHVFKTIHFSDVIPATIKTFAFGFSIGIIGCYKGYHAEKGTEGVGRAANSAVVIASIAIFVIDMIVVQIENFF
jgi:phospholipid/cholesterol/gamma-HCH transport system permease protein